MLLRNRFLNTASFLSGPNDKPGEGGAAGDDQNGDAGAGDDQSGADDTGAEGGADAGDDTGTDDGVDDDGADDDGADADGDDGVDEDDDLAGLTPEQKKKVQAKLDKETRWRDRQIDKLYAKTRSAQEDVQAAATITGKRPAAQPGENLTAEQIEERARTLAGQMSAQEKYDADANAAHAAGVKAYGDKWNKTLAKLPKLGGIDVPDMVDILATDHPETVLFSLSDPDTYERVMSLPPAKRRTEIVKLGTKAPPKRADAKTESKRPGDIPPPVRPVGGGRQVAAQTVNIYDDKISDDAWYAARNASRRKKFSQVD